jgi:flagellin-like protein
MTKLQSKQNKLTSRRAVAPVIATLLLVAIAVVGGSIVFVFSQGFFSSAQISGSPNIESLKIVGYDATDGPVLQIHDGLASGVNQGDPLVNDGLVAGDRVAVYLQNQSVQKVTLSEIRLAGTVYSFVSSAAGTIDAYDALPGAGILAGQAGPSYMIATDSNGSPGTETAATVLQTTSAEIQPGQQATVIIQLDENVKVGRDAQFKLTVLSSLELLLQVNKVDNSTLFSFLRKKTE